ASLITIEDSAFADCTGLVTVSMQSGVTSIGQWAFAGCTGLTSVTLPDTLTELGREAFYGCTSLTSLAIPASVTSIGAWLTSGCTSLTEIVVEEGNSAYASVGGVLFNAALTELICCPIGYVGDYTVPDGVTAIDESAFEGCTGLTSVTLPASLITIEDSAFADCTGLVAVSMQSGITSIGSHAFHGCTSLTSISLPDSVTDLGSYVFQNCTSLTTVQLPASLTGISAGMFYGCTGLSSITLPDTVTAINEYAFGDCTSLTALVLPDSLTLIGYCAFTGCTQLTAMVLPDSVSSVYAYAFKNCTALENITIYNNSITLNANVFYGCDALTIYGNSGSSAKQYAAAYNIPFVALDTVETVDLSACTITLEGTEFVCDGTAQTPAVTVSDGDSVLTEGTDYTLSYSNNVQPGTATVLVTGVGGYTGSLTASFSITLATPVLAELQSGEEGILVSWTEIPGAECYVLYRASDGGAVHELATVYSGTVSYVDADVTSGTLYRYQLVAICGDVSSAMSVGQQLQYLTMTITTDPTDTDAGDGTADTTAGDAAAQSAASEDGSDEAEADGTTAVASLNTGDQSNLAVWCGALLLSGGALAAAVLFRCRRHKK
ncbi:MAG: leucine-rich repeat domain-containing protein, partial [Clostridiales bacterium]|nr:leucine-rich repeat domain-containing protein [Clostridiales bacterium]